MGAQKSRGGIHVENFSVLHAGPDSVFSALLALGRMPRAAVRPRKASMNLRTYRARTMGDALAEVKKDLGRDAVILHTRTYKVGGWLGFGGRPMVEVTASDAVNVPQRARRSSPEPQRAVSAAAAKAYGAPAQPAPVPEPVLAGGPSEDGSGLKAVVQAALSAQPSTAVLAPALETEIAAIKRMVGQVLQCSRHTALRVGEGSGGVPGGAMPDALSQHYLRLIEGEVAAEIADEVIAAVRDELTPAELSDGAIVQQTILRHLAGMIPADAEVPKAQARDGRPLTIALVGPTGVGKTTTVAKLAAAYKLRHGKRVGLVTSDTYRIAAVDQLRTYAEIIGLPLKVALSPTEMATVCQGLADCDVILIDTAGRSQRDAGRLDELRQFISAAKPHQTHLVLSSTASQAVLIEAAERFAQVKPDRVIFTKLDEAVNFGVILTVARRLTLKLSYVTTGQEVPDHIEVGRPDRLARLLLEGGKAR
jgi:flagellar biosynthesis protein FlhF